MSAIFETYDFPLTSLRDLYPRLNRFISYPDGMQVTLDTLFWGREQHYRDIDAAIPRLTAGGMGKFSDLLQAARTPARARQLVERTGISAGLVRVLCHDLDLWLPRQVHLDQLQVWLPSLPWLQPFTRLGLDDQLEVISAGRTTAARTDLALRTCLPVLDVDKVIRVCDFHRTGRSLEHIRARIYYAMALDTFQEWSQQSSENVIEMFAAYVRKNPDLEDRLVPFPREVRNAIEWAKWHLEIYSVQW
jgi:hypothetical protein